jgi:septum formation protein
MEIPQIILASTSPRRKELLAQIGVSFTAIPSGQTEDVEASISAVEAVQILAERKAAAVAADYPDALVIGSDTVIGLDDAVIGKPEDPDGAKAMLRRMAGRTHQVVSGVALLWNAKGVREIFHVVTDVTFGSLSAETIDRYVATGEPLDKAGAYAIQGAGAVLVESVNGSYYNIVGLPIYEVASALMRHFGSGVCLRPKEEDNFKRERVG